MGVKNGAGDEARTRTGVSTHGILSPNTTKFHNSSQLKTSMISTRFQHSLVVVFGQKWPKFVAECPASVPREGTKAESFCSVNARGVYRRPPRVFEVPIWNFKASYSSGVSLNMKSSGSRLAFWLTSLLRFFVSIPYSSAKLSFSMTFSLRMRQSHGGRFLLCSTYCPESAR